MISWSRHTLNASLYDMPCNLWNIGFVSCRMSDLQSTRNVQFALLHDAFTMWKNVDKSPAVARVSRPYSWCTLATRVHNCPSMMFRTCCCLRPKCKRSYLLIYITSGSYVNKLCKQVKRSIPRRNTCVANCGQTAAVGDMVTIDSL